jgi:hypothetical protein
MQISPAETQTYLTFLEATPHRLASASDGIESARLHFKPDENTWSANDILAHLRTCADLWSKSMTAMIEQDWPTLRYVSPRTWVKKTGYLALEFHVSLMAFTAQRSDFVAWLKTLSMQDWSRGATFTGTTQGRNHTVFTYMRRMVKHEIVHCEQIEALLK